jgi:hypothetical protein
LRFGEISWKVFFFSGDMIQQTERMYYLETNKKIILSPTIYKIMASRDYYFEMYESKPLGNIFRFFPRK